MISKLKNLTVFSLVIFLFWSCDQKEKQMLQSRVDSLQVELETSMQMAGTLQEIGVLIDTIDASRQLLRTNVIEGTSYTDYNSRLTDINDYIKQTQNKIEELEKAMKKSSANYSATIKRLKADLASSKEQLASLQAEVDQVRGENETLKLTITRKDEALAEQNEKLQLREQDVADLEAEVQAVTTASTNSKAELFFAQAKALETAAERTKLAPKKKKETQREALQLYKASLELGHPDAQSRISLLEKELG